MDAASRPVSPVADAECVMERYRRALVALGARPVDGDPGAGAGAALALFGHVWVVRPLPLDVGTAIVCEATSGLPLQRSLFGVLDIYQPGATGLRLVDGWQVDLDDAELPESALPQQLTDFWHRMNGCGSLRPLHEWCTDCVTLAADEAGEAGEAGGAVTQTGTPARPGR
jgi:hypothetical protein